MRIARGVGVGMRPSPRAHISAGGVGHVHR